MKKILIADDEESIRYSFGAFLEEAGYSVNSVDSLSKCIKKLQADSFDLLFLDMYLGSDNSIEVIRDLKILRPDCAIVVITGKLDSAAITKARKLGALDYLVKPIRQPSLLYVTRKVLEQQDIANH